MSELRVDSGQTYTVAASTTEEWESADVEGALEVQGTLILRDQTSFAAPQGGIDLFDGFDIPLRIHSLTGMQMGLATFVIGLFAILGGGSWLLRNWAAAVLLGLAIVALILAGTIGIGLELFWALMVLVVLTLVVGAIGRVMMQ